MDRPRIVFAGASGWLGRYIGPGLLRAGVTAPDRFAALNRSGPSDAYAQWPQVSWHRTLAEAPAADVLVLSVRPADFRAATFHAPDALVISVMAGVTMAELAQATGSDRIVRCLPNALAETGQSYTPWLASDTVTRPERTLVRHILRAVGSEAQVADEHALDILTALSGAGPAYVALLATGLMQAARDLGLPPEIAAGAVENITCAAAQQLQGRISDAPAVAQSFIDYDGVIAEGLRTARAEGFDRALSEALRLSLAKVQQMNG